MAWACMSRKACASPCSARTRAISFSASCSQSPPEQPRLPRLPIPQDPAPFQQPRKKIVHFCSSLDTTSPCRLHCKPCRRSPACHLARRSLAGGTRCAPATTTLASGIWAELSATPLLADFLCYPLPDACFKPFRRGILPDIRALSLLLDIRDSRRAPRAALASSSARLP
jgi:hypothetical protein